MNTTRKQFLRNAALIAGSSMLPLKGIFSAPQKLEAPPPLPFTACTDLYTSGGAEPYSYGWVNNEFSYAKTNLNINIKDVQYALDSLGGCMPSNLCPDIDTSALKFRICYPSLTLNDPPINVRFPVFIFFHASGFQECFAYTDPDNIHFCQEMAKR